MSNGSKVSIPFGGQTPIPRVPVKTSLYSAKNVLGKRLASKKAQKKATKNITSEVINRAIPHLRPISVIEL